MTTFYADISEFQTVVNDSYPYPVLAFRVDNGGRLDYHAAANWAHCRGSSKIQVAVGYVVFRVGQRANILRRVKELFGAAPPPPKLALMIDMESGQGFAGPGNHSTEANALAADLAAYLGSEQRVVGYANHYDFASNWPTRPAWLKLITASYGSQNPGTFGWQYYGGVPNPRPAGYPNSCPPFGSNVDLNAIQLPIASIVEQFGLGDIVTPEDRAAIAAQVWATPWVGAAGKSYPASTYLINANKYAGYAYTLVAELKAEVAALKAEVDSIKAKDNA